MFPGFVTAYKDKKEFVHLYFFPGIAVKQKDRIYRTIDLSNCKFKYDFHENIDGSIDYTFHDKSIKKIFCKLITYQNDYTYENLYI